jgi:hypothetical protein
MILAQFCFKKCLIVVPMNEAAILAASFIGFGDSAYNYLPFIFFFAA